MDNNKWPAVRGWLPDRQPPGGGMYPGVDDFQGPAGGPYGGPGYGGGAYGGPSGYGGGFFGGPSGGYGQGYGGGGGGLLNLPFNLGQLKMFIDRMGGLDGILNTIGKMQRLFGTMQQLAPLVRLLLAKKSSTSDAEEELEAPRRKRKRGGQRRRRRGAAGRSGSRPRRGGAGRRRPGAGRRTGGGYARVRAASGPAGKRTGARTRDRFRVPDHDREPADLPPDGLYLP